MKRVLDQIKQANDIKKIPPLLYPTLAQDIRQFLLENISETGGHLASNLGIVEITMALHVCLNLPEDKIIFDVGHQSYVHKILTGRKNQFDTLRKKDGLCGFPKRKESEYDCFGTGHSSTSIAAAMGFAAARDIKGSDETIVAVIGDGALSGGLAFEGLNNLASFKKKKKNMIVILNDNKMSISENVGGMSGYLKDIRYRERYGYLKENVETFLNHIPGVGTQVARTLKKSKDSIKQMIVPGMMFEDMGISYYGPIDGHDMDKLIRAIEVAKRKNGPILIHAITKKGMGYEIAERNPEKFHGIDAFDLETGNVRKPKKKDTWTNVFSKELVSLAEAREHVVAITAAMPSGTGLKAFKEAYPSRFFDVGIAEEYAVTFAGGLAGNGLKPVVAVYSSFLQRAYDQILHDICIQKLPVLFCIDRSGLVGADGETHQGIFDISYLSHIPNLTIMAPKNEWELRQMLAYGIDYDGPIALKYPRGEAYDGLEEYQEPILQGKSEWISRLKSQERPVTGQGTPEKQVILFSLGNMIEEALPLKEQLEQAGCDTGLCNVRFIRPLDEDLLHEAAKSGATLVTIEENELSGGYGQMVSSFLHKYGYANKLVTFGIPDVFVEHASVTEQRRMLGIDADSMFASLQEVLKK